MVEVSVAKLGVDSASQSYVVILQERGGERLLPIWIGQPEAESIVMQMNNVKRERPLTHDLCKSLIVGMGATLQSVHITKVVKSTYYAELHIALNGNTVHIDARPSDSIAIALRLSAPIFAEESLLTVMEQEEDEAVIPPEPPPTPEELNAEQLQKYLEQLRPEDFGKFNL